MATNWKDLVTSRGATIGGGSGDAPSFYPQAGVYDYDNPRNEAATLARWRPDLERLNIRVLGVHDVPQEPVQVTLDNMNWTLERIHIGRYGVPEDAYERICAAAAAGIPFRYYLYGKEEGEQFDRPEFYPLGRQVPEQRKDPCVVGIILTAPQRGIWCLLAKWLD